MQICLSRSEWPTVISEIYRVLKPGGWIQLVEADFPSGITQEFRDVAPATTELLGLLQETLFTPFDRIWDTRASLPGLIEDAGFERLLLDERIFGMEGAVGGRSTGNLEELDGLEASMLADFALDNMVKGLESIKGRSEQEGEDLARLMELCKGKWKDVEKGEPRLGARWHTYCAQKPL